MAQGQQADNYSITQFCTIALYLSMNPLGVSESVRVSENRRCRLIVIRGSCWRLPIRDRTILPSAPSHTYFYSLSLHHRTVHLIVTTMSHALSTSASTSSSNFQSIFDAALKAYEKKTKKDLLTHPLAVQLQACNTPSDILAILQDKVNELDQSMSASERLSQWLNPTINVLYSFSSTIGAGVGLVSAVKSTCLLPLISVPGILACISHLLGCWGTPFGEAFPLIPLWR